MFGRRSPFNDYFQHRSQAMPDSQTIMKQLVVQDTQLLKSIYLEMSEGRGDLQSIARSLRFLTRSLSKTQHNFIKERVRELLGNGLIELLLYIEEAGLSRSVVAQRLLSTTQDLARIIGLVYPRGIPNQIRTLGKRSFSSYTNRKENSRRRSTPRQNRNRSIEREPTQAHSTQQFPPEPPPRFPQHWGNPPRRQTRDRVRLPGGYGFGSSTLANWVNKNFKSDIERQTEDESDSEFEEELDENEEDNLDPKNEDPETPLKVSNIPVATPVDEEPTIVQNGVQNNTNETNQKKQKLKPPLNRQFSVQSEGAILKLQRLQSELLGYENRVHEIDTQSANVSTVTDSPKCRSASGELTQEGITEVREMYGGWKTELGQLGGQVESLQFKGLDSIMVGGLTSGKDDAKKLRKSLNRRVVVLNKEIKRMHSKLGHEMFSLIGH